MRHTLFDQMFELMCSARLHFTHRGICSCPSHCIVRQIDAGFHTQQAVHCSDLRSKASGCLIPVRSGFLGLRFNRVIRFGVVSAARSFHCVCVKNFSCIVQFLLNSFRTFFGMSSSHLTTGVPRSCQVLCRIFEDCVV